MKNNLTQIYRGIVEESSKKSLCGNCITVFDKNGNRKRNMGSVPYRDASDFDVAITDDNNNNKEELKIPKEEFLKHVHVGENQSHILNNPNTEFLFLPERDSHIMYDADKDVHHFYEH